MALILLLALLLLLGLTLLSGDWRNGLLLSLVLGFAQDPIRKLTPGQPGLFVGIALVAFASSAFCLYSEKQGRLELPLMFRGRPQLVNLLSLFATLIALQSLNGLVRWGNVLRVGVGIGFYFAPLAGLWLGFQLGRDQPFLRRFLHLYLLLASLFAATVLLDYIGVDIPLLKEVGEGIRIDIAPGLSVFGASGLWRSSELAAWHLAASSCLSIALAASLPFGASRWPYVSYSITAALLTIVTGRRKAIVQIIVFLGIYLWMSSRPGAPASRQRLVGILLTLAGVVAFIAFIGPAELFGDQFILYAQRSATAPGELTSRFNQLAVNAFWRGIEISDGLGLGVGTLAQTGASGIKDASGASFGFVSESGVGKVIAELGVGGLILIPLLLYQLTRAVWGNLQRLRQTSAAIQTLETGLVAFAVSNMLFFSAAAGVYGDPLVLTICGVCLGSVFAAPALLASRAGARG